MDLLRGPSVGSGQDQSFLYTYTSCEPKGVGTNCVRNERKQLVCRAIKWTRKNRLKKGTRYCGKTAREVKYAQTLSCLSVWGHPKVFSLLSAWEINGLAGVVESEINVAKGYFFEKNERIYAHIYIRVVYRDMLQHCIAFLYGLVVLQEWVW